MLRGRYDLCMKTFLVVCGLLLGQAVAGNLKGLIVLAADGTFLGTCDGTGSNSVANEYGRFGSEYGVTSIRNQYGMYGGQYSLKSPYNPYSMSAPYIFGKSPELLAFVTKLGYRPSTDVINTLKTGSTPRLSKNKVLLNAIDPDVFIDACLTP